MMVPESLHNEQNKRERCTLYVKSREIRYDGAGRCMKMYEYVAGQKKSNHKAILCTLKGLARLLGLRD